MKVKIRGLLIVTIVMLLTLVACGSEDESKYVTKESSQSLNNLTDTEMPIVKEPIHLKFFTSKSNENSKTDFNDILIWNEYEKMSNVNIEWEQTHIDSLPEKRNLKLVGNGMPDVFFSSRMPVIDILKYGEQGVFIPLNDLIDEYAPHFNKMLETYPEIEKAITFPDGNIYSLPIIYEPEFSSLIMGASPLFNIDVLNELDLDIPRTTDELYDFLTIIKSYNETADEQVIPLGARNMDYLFSWLQGSFGVANKGVDYIDLNNETDTLRFYPISDSYKELLEYLHLLYREELIEHNIYTHEYGDFLTKFDGGDYASSYYFASNDNEDMYASGYTLEGPHGDHDFIRIAHPMAIIGQFIITEENEHPEASMRWVDYFYSDAGSRLFYMGIEDETYEALDDGTFEYVDHITNNPDGLSLNDAITEDLVWISAGAPGIIKQKYFAGTENSQAAIKAAEKVKPDFISERWPAFLYTDEENKKLEALASDIEKYADEKRDQFINGSASFDDWDDYIDKIYDMGLDDYMAIKEKAYERYLDN